MIELTETEIAQYYRVRVPGLRKVQGQVRGPCPVHGGKDLNFSLEPETGRSYCHSQCGRGFDVFSLEMELSACDFVAAKASVYEIVGRPKDDWQDREIVATYDYRDADGNLIYQVVRKTPGADGRKRFLQRRPEPGGKWKWGLGKVKPLPFRLPEMVKANVVAVCYSSDTEILTRTGWVPFQSLTSQDEVAQYWASDGGVQFTRPSAIQRFLYTGTMVNFSSDWSDLLVTPEHRVISRGKTKGKWLSPVVKQAQEINSHRYYPTSGFSQGSGGPNEDQARLLAAWCGDGINEKRGHKISWNLKKDRKVQRLYLLLRRLGIPFSIHTYESCSEWTNVRAVRESVKFLDEFAPRKVIPMSAMSWSLTARNAFLEELRYWDGDSTGPDGSRFFTSKQEEAEAVSAIAAISGWGCIVRKDNRPKRPNNNTAFVVNLARKQWRMMSRKPSRENYTGDVFCCTVPSGFLIVRRNGKTMVSGNCEGEKDALNLVRAGWVATCNNGGAGNFKPELVPYFAAKHVAIFPDNDEAGRKHAEAVAGLLASVAASVKVVEMPDLPLKGDVSDFLASGKTGSDLRQLWRDAEEWTPDWEFVSEIPHENDKYMRTFAQCVREAGGFDGFWKSVEVEGIPTPFPNLTAQLKGLRAGEVYVIGARTGQGKTSLALQFAGTAIANRVPPLLFSMEMGHRDAFQRMAGIEARADLTRYAWLRKHHPTSLDAKDMERDLRQATEKFSRVPFYVTTKTGVTPEFLIQESKRMKERAGVGLVIVDHMQLMGASGRVKGDYEKFTAISRATKEIAVELNVPLILVSQVSRNNAVDKRVELEMSDLRGSGAIEEDAAGIMLLYYDAEDFSQAKNDPKRMAAGPIRTWLKLAKNRFGAAGTYEELWHMKAITRFDQASEANHE